MFVKLNLVIQSINRVKLLQPQTLVTFHTAKWMCMNIDCFIWICASKERDSIIFRTNDGMSDKLLRRGMDWWGQEALKNNVLLWHGLKMFSEDCWCKILHVNKTLFLRSVWLLLCSDSLLHIWRKSKNTPSSPYTPVVCFSSEFLNKGLLNCLFPSPLQSPFLVKRIFPSSLNLSECHSFLQSCLHPLHITLSPFSLSPHIYLSFFFARSWHKK